MNKVFRAILALLGLMFFLMGVRWLGDPAAMAAQLGMPLLDGVGRSTQIGDLSAFFFCTGGFMLLGVITEKSRWFIPSAALLGLTAAGRIFAWLVHDAAFAADAIAVELVATALLVVAIRKSPYKD